MLLITPFSPEFEPAPIPYHDHKTGLEKAVQWLKEARQDQQEMVIDIRRVFSDYRAVFIGSFGYSPDMGVDDIPALEELLDNCP